MRVGGVCRRAMLASRLEPRAEVLKRTHRKRPTGTDRSGAIKQ